MQKLFLIGWLIYFFVALCTRDLQAFLYNYEVSFLFNPRPNWTDLIASSFQDTSFYYFAKSGHTFMFAMLVLLLYSNFHRLGIVVLCSVILAISSEVLQLFFHRTGRVLDMFIDGIGIGLGVVLLMVYFWLRTAARYRGNSVGESASRYDGD